MLKTNTFFRTIKQEYLFIYLLIFSVIASLLWILIIPYNGANDEYTHYSTSIFIADEKRLPIYNNDEYIKVNCREISAIELGKKIYGYACVSSYSAFPLMSYLIPVPFIKLIGKNSPYRYILARLPAIFYFAIFSIIVWQILKKIFPSKFTHLIASASVLFIPQVTFIYSYVNSDGFSLTISSLIIFLWVKLISSGYTRKNILLGAISLGLLASTKHNYFILFPATFILTTLLINRVNWKKYLCFWIASMIGVLTISGWWYVRNYFLYSGDIFGFATVKSALLNSAPHYTTLADQGQNFITVLLATNWPILSFKSFFATFGWMSIYLPDIFYIVIYFFIAISLFGWLLYFIDLYAQKQIFSFFKSKLFPLTIASLFTIIGSISLSVWTSLNNDFQPQGRYLFPAFILILIAIIKGLRYFNQMIKISDRVMLIAFTGWITITWFFSYMMIIFYYEIIRNDLYLLRSTAYLEDTHYALQNDYLRISLLTGGTLILIFIIIKIWKNILRSHNSS